MKPCINANNVVVLNSSRAAPTRGHFIKILPKIFTRDVKLIPSLVENPAWSRYIHFKSDIDIIPAFANKTRNVHPLSEAFSRHARICPSHCRWSRNSAAQGARTGTRF
jgi:hypothetical protein